MKCIITKEFRVSFTLDYVIMIPSSSNNYFKLPVLHQIKYVSYVFIVQAMYIAKLC